MGKLIKVDSICIPNIFLFAYFLMFFSLQKKKSYFQYKFIVENLSTLQNYDVNDKCNMDDKIQWY
jgi:hypothetical protein